MTLQLREYQTNGINRVRAAFAQGKRAPILVSPTGSGKTVCAAEIIRSAVAKNKRVLFLAHRHELCCQAARKLAACGIRHAVVAQTGSIEQIRDAQIREIGRSLVDQEAPVSVGMVQTVVRRLGLIGRPDLIIVDESHMSVSATYKTILAKFPAAKIIGLTATPTRLSGEGMDEIYDDLIVLCQPQELLNMGHLVDVRAFAARVRPDMRGIGTSMGDYARGELGAAMNKPAITGDAVEHYRRHAHGRRAIAFCVTVAHAKSVSAEFAAAGYRAVAVDGDTDDDERSRAIDMLAKGEVDIVANCGLYIEGLDCPAIECVIDLAPTKSLTRFLQKIGRGLRPSPATGKTNLICLDHAGNFETHGHPYDDREWTLDGKKSHQDDDAPDVRVVCCGNLHYYRPQDARPIDDTPGSPKRRCPYCDWIAPITERKIETKKGRLEEIRREEMARKEVRQQQGRAQTVEELMRSVPGMTRWRAMKIVQAREEKDRLIQAAAAKGFSLSALRKMKPKELKELIK